MKRLRMPTPLYYVLSVRAYVIWYSFLFVIAGCSESSPRRTPEAPGCRGNMIPTMTMGNWDVVPFQRFSGEFEVGVVGFHEEGVDVVFYGNDVEAGRVTDPARNPRTGWTSILSRLMWPGFLSRRCGISFCDRAARCSIARRPAAGCCPWCPRSQVDHRSYNPSTRGYSQKLWRRSEYLHRIWLHDLAGFHTGSVYPHQMNRLGMVGDSIC